MHAIKIKTKQLIAMLEVFSVAHRELLVRSFRHTHE